MENTYEKNKKIELFVISEFHLCNLHNGGYIQLTIPTCNQSAIYETTFGELVKLNDENESITKDLLVNRMDEISSDICPSVSTLSEKIDYRKIIDEFEIYDDLFPEELKNETDQDVFLEHLKNKYPSLLIEHAVIIIISDGSNDINSNIIDSEYKALYNLYSLELMNDTFDTDVCGGFVGYMPRIITTSIDDLVSYFSNETFENIEYKMDTVVSENNEGDEKNENRSNF